MRFELFQDEREKWRWRGIAPENGNVLCDSGQGYADQRDAVHGLERVLLALHDPETTVGYDDDSGLLRALPAVPAAATERPLGSNPVGCDTCGSTVGVRRLTSGTFCLACLP